MGLFSVITNGAAAFLTVGMLYWAQNYQITVLPLLIDLVACFVLEFACITALPSRWPWAMHIIHHSSQRFSFALPSILPAQRLTGAGRL